MYNFFPPRIIIFDKKWLIEIFASYISLSCVQCHSPLPQKVIKYSFWWRDIQQQHYEKNQRSSLLVAARCKMWTENDKKNNGRFCYIQVDQKVSNDDAAHVLMWSLEIDTFPAMVLYTKTNSNIFPQNYLFKMDMIVDMWLARYLLHDKLLCFGILTH